MYSSLWVSRTGSASDWCALQEALYKYIDTIQIIQYNSEKTDTDKNHPGQNLPDKRPPDKNPREQLRQNLYKGPSIYDVHKKITFLTPPVHMRPHGPDPLPPCGRPHTVDMKYTPLS